MNLIEDIIRDTCNKLSGFTGAVMLPDYKSNVLRTTVSYNLPETWQKLTNPFSGQTNNGIAFTEKRTVILYNQNKSTLRDTKPYHRIESTIVVPLFNNNEVIGTFIILGDKKDIQYSVEQELFMKSAAKQIAMLLK